MNKIDGLLHWSAQTNAIERFVQSYCLFNVFERAELPSDCLVCVTNIYALKTAICSFILY